MHAKAVHRGRAQGALGTAHVEGKPPAVVLQGVLHRLQHAVAAGTPSNEALEDACASVGICCLTHALAKGPRQPDAGTQCVASLCAKQQFRSIARTDVILEVCNTMPIRYLNLVHLLLTAS